MRLSQVAAVGVIPGLGDDTILRALDAVGPVLAGLVDVAVAVAAVAGLQRDGRRAEGAGDGRDGCAGRTLADESHGDLVGAQTGAAVEPG